MAANEKADAQKFATSGRNRPKRTLDEIISTAENGTRRHKISANTLAKNDVIQSFTEVNRPYTVLPKDAPNQLNL